MAFDLKDSRNQKLVLAVTVLCLGVYFWYTRFFSPDQHQIASRIADHERILGDLRSVEMKAKSFDVLRDEYEALYRQYLQISSLLPDQRQLEDFLHGCIGGENDFLLGKDIALIDPNLYPNTP